MGKRAAILTLALLVTAGQAVAACRDDRVSLRGDWGGAQFSVEVADDAAERARGLMFREEMPKSAGMLFVYDTPRSVAFWMKNTLIPLDMIFADSAGVVQKVHSNAIPRDETAIPGGDGIQYVLEINSGLADAMGIGEGSEMQHPALGPQAAWPCEP